MNEINIEEEEPNIIVKDKMTVDEILDRGYDSSAYKDIIGIRAITGGEENILFECNEQQATILAVMEAVFAPRDASGKIDQDIAYDDALGLTVVRQVKLNMKSHKRKGLMELVKVLVGKQDEDDGVANKVKAAIQGED